MARAAAPLAAACVLLLALACSAAASQVPLSWELGVGGEDDGLGYEYEAVARRVLQTGGYISYGALRRDATPCSVRGASYYNCRPGAQANPYSRGCSAITRCRG